MMLGWFGLAGLLVAPGVAGVQARPMPDGK